MESSSATLQSRPDEPSASPVHPEEQPTWTARPVVALLLRVAIFLAPIAASVGASYLFARRWPRPDGMLAILGWLALLVLVGGIAMVAVDRLARRFLPLAALLRMTLIFPDQAPSRFNLAIRSGTTKQLERRLEHVREHGLGDTEAEAAESLLELAAALRQHDRFTRGHGERVRAYSALIGEEMGLDPVEISKLQWAGLIHDVGKLAVPEEVLNKPGRLTAEEYELIKTHPAEGMAMIGPLSGWLGDWALAVGEHHERWDGAGYPNGLAGADISLAGRIVAVADTFDVITATRSYKESQSPQWARQELANNAGTQFDPDVVRAFLNVSLGRLRGVMWPLSWIAHLPYVGSALTAPATGLAAASVVVVGSSVTGGSIAADLPPEIDLIPRSGVIAAPVAEPDATPPASTIVVAAPLPADVSDASGVAPVVVVVTSTTSPADPGLPSIVTVPPATTSPVVAGDGPTPTIVVTLPPALAPTTTQPATGQTPTTLAATPPPATPPGATPPATTLPATTLPATTLPATTAPATTTAPTTLAGSTCADARAGATNLSGADLSGCNLSGRDLTGVDLSGADLSEADLSGVALTDFDLTGADLTEANLDGAVLTNGTLRDADLTELSGEEIRMDGVDLAGSDLTDVELDDGVFVAVSFAGARARDADFSGGKFHAVSFVNAELHDASFDDAIMPGAQMSGAIARRASFSNIDAPGSNWSSADLRNATFSDANLTSGDLTAADVRNVDFGGTGLRDVAGVPVRASSAQYSDTICPDGNVQSSNCWP